MKKMKTAPLKMKVTPEKLRSMVVDLGMSDVAIGRELGACSVTVAKWRDFFGIAQPVRERKVYESAAPPDNFFVSEADLRRMYCDDGMSQQKIGEALGVSQVTVSQWLRKYDIATRNVGGNKQVFLDEDVLRDLYHQKKLSMAEIAAGLGCAESVVRVNLLRFGLNVTAAEINQRRKDNNKDSCSFETVQNGYRAVRVDGHPRSMATGYVGEHVIVAEKAVGRYVESSEDVHHINLNKLDNSITNLAIVSRADHARLHKYMERLGAYMFAGGSRPAPLEFDQPVFWAGQWVNSIDLASLPMARAVNTMIENLVEDTTIPVVD